MRRLALMCLAALAGCGSKNDPPKTDPAPAPVKPEPSKGSAAAKPKPKPKADKKLTPEQLAEFKKRMKAGWAKQKDSKWAEAVPEFEAALVASASDQRALTELGWSALQAGDFPKAKKATEQAIRVAVDKKVKAAALYNLGLTQDKSGDKEGALKSFIASLSLRPNAIVEKAVGKLGASVDKPPPMCAAGVAPCKCVLDVAFDEIQLDQAKCEEIADKAAPPGIKVVKVTSDAFYGSEYTYWLDEAGRELVAIVGGSDGRGRYSEQTKLSKIERKTIGGKTVLWIETKTTGESMYFSIDQDSPQGDIDETTEVTLCVLGDAKAPTRCPLRVPVTHVVDTGSTDDGAKRTRVETTVELTIAEDGTATVKLVKGASDGQLTKLVGPHKLW